MRNRTEFQASIGVDDCIVAFVFLRGAFVGEVTGPVELIDSLQFLSLQTLGRKLSPASETQVLLVASKTTPAILGTLNSLFSKPRVQESTLAPVVLSLLFLLVLRLQQSYRRCLLPLGPSFPSKVSKIITGKSYREFLFVSFVCRKFWFILPSVGVTIIIGSTSFCCKHGY